MANLILFDMDGTLSDDSHRRDLYVAGGFSEYWRHEKMMADPAFPQALELYKEHEDAGDAIGILTARLSEYNSSVTDMWLNKNGLYPQYMFLRHSFEKELRPPEFKLEVMKDILSMQEIEGWSQVILYDNDPEVVAKISQELGPQYVVHCTWDNEKDPA